MELGIIPLLLICFLFSFFFWGEGGLRHHLPRLLIVTNLHLKTQNMLDVFLHVVTCFLELLDISPWSHDLFNYIILKIHYLGGYHPHPVYLSWLMITLSTQVIELENFGSFLSFSFLLLISCSQI